MVYVPSHKRKVVGSQIHKTIEMKKDALREKEAELEQLDSSLSEIRKGGNFNEIQCIA